MVDWEFPISPGMPWETLESLSQFSQHGSDHFLQLVLNLCDLVSWTGGEGNAAAEGGASWINVSEGEMVLVSLSCHLRAGLLRS